MKELRHKMRIWRILLVFLLLPSGVYAQDKHSYATPLGKSIFHREVRDANRTVLKMSEVSPISAGIDGLVLVFNMRQDLSKVTRPLKLVSFNSTSEEANSHLEIYYHQGTITIRRKTARIQRITIIICMILCLLLTEEMYSGKCIYILRPISCG